MQCVARSAVDAAVHARIAHRDAAVRLHREGTAECHQVVAYDGVRYVSVRKGGHWAALPQRRCKPEALGPTRGALLALGRARPAVTIVRGGCTRRRPSSRLRPQLVRGRDPHWARPWL
eukprot:scaffold15271_cov110-Isochrysis_galbana.AAC.3